MKCDFHVHTFYSFDSSTSPEEMVDAALKLGIDCLAITDHNEIEGAKKAIEYAKEKPILIIPGIEVKSKEGDIIGLNVKEKIPPKLSAKETIKKIKEQGGFVILPHPFAFFCKFKGNLKELIKEIDAIEILNGANFGGHKKAIKFVEKYNLPFTVGSDAHFPELLGKVLLEVEGEKLKIEEVLEKIKNKKTKIIDNGIGFWEKIFDHLKRAKVKISNYVGRKKRKI